MNSTESRWQVGEAAGEATRVGGTHVHAFWPLLAPSFRWVLLPPHRRADGDRITWEWRGAHERRVPLPSDLEDLRLRLRDGLDLLEDDLKRAPALPERVSAEDLSDAMKEALHELRFGPDTTLAAHAVYTTHGWMLRSWGFPKPSPATSDAERSQEDDAEPIVQAAPSPAPSPFARTAGRARRLPTRRLIAGLLGAALALGLAYCGRHGAGLAPIRTQAAASPAATSPLPAATPAKSEKGRAEAAASPRSTHAAGSSGPHAESIARVATPAASVAAPAAPPPRHASESPSAVPLAITGTPPTMPGAQVGQAGPSSTLPAKADQGLAPPLPHRDSPAPAPQASGSGEDQLAPPSKREGAGPPPPVASASESAATAAAATRFVQTEGNIGEPTTTSTPRPFAVDARQTPDPASDAPPPRAVVSSFPIQSPRSPAPTNSATAPRASRTATSARETPGAEAVTPAAASPASPPRWPPENPDELRVLFRGSPMPWRLVLERDAPLPTRPSEGAAEEEMRAARIEAWARARALLPPILRRREGGRVGWTFRFAADAGDDPKPVWRDARSGAALPERMVATSRGSTSIGWFESEAKDLDALLVDAAGRAWARVRRSAAENRTLLDAGREIVAARPWFALRVGEGEADGAEELRAPAGWELRRRGDELVAEGPADATRFRWEHPASGWVLHGGYARDSR